MAKSQTLEIRPILQRMADKSRICSMAVGSTVQAMGEKPLVNKANLRKAVHLRGSTNFRKFCQEWLGWPDDLVMHLERLEERVVWTRPFCNRPFDIRQKQVAKIHVAAVLAWIKEMNKP